MNYESSNALLNACIENNTTRKRNTVTTYVRETLRVLRNCFNQQDKFDLSALHDTTKYTQWVIDNISVKRRDNITNSIHGVCNMLGLKDLKTEYKAVLTTIRIKYKNEKAMALTKRTKKQIDSWVAYETLKENRDAFLTAFDKRKFPKGRGKNAFTDAMIWACFVNDKFVLRPSELRTMLIVDDKVNNYFDIANKKMYIRQHKNDKLNGVRIIDNVPDIIVKYVSLYHDRYPGLTVMIPTTTGKVQFINKFTERVQKTTGVQPSILRTIFVSDVASKMEDEERVLTAQNMGHTFITSRMVYQKD